MQRKDYLILLIITGLPFILYALFSAGLMGADSYYYLDIVCHRGYDDSDPLFGAIMHILPCNVFLLKFYLFLLFFGSAIVMAKTVELFNFRAALYGGIVFSSFSFVLLEFFKFENDTLGYFLGILAMYFLLRYCYKSKNPGDIVIAIGIIILAGLSWQGAVYWLLPFVGNLAKK